MQYWFDDTWQQIQNSEALITNGVHALLRGWQNPAIVVDALCTGAERWQKAIRQFQAPMNLADILRARSVFGR